MNVDGFYDSPLWIGAGEREFDGLLDDVRLFNRVLTPVEVSILNQPDTNQPRALLPIPRSSNVVISTDVTWVPATGATAQKVYFGTDPDANNLSLKKQSAMAQQIWHQMLRLADHYRLILSIIGILNQPSVVMIQMARSGRLPPKQARRSIRLPRTVRKI